VPPKIPADLCRITALERSENVVRHQSVCLSIIVEKDVSASVVYIIISDYDGVTPNGLVMEVLYWDLHGLVNQIIYTFGATWISPSILHSYREWY
jgi:hypothetical protein